MKIAPAFLLALFLAISTRTFSQHPVCDCRSDILFLNERIEGTTSYKRNKKAYEEALKFALQSSTADVLFYECFEILNRLTISLNDWHIGIYESTPDGSKSRATMYPKVNNDLDSLEQILRKKPFTSIEGIYHQQGIKFGILFDPAEEVYKAVVLETSSDAWKKGEVIYKYIPLPNKFLKAIGGQYPGKRMISYYERIENGVVLRAGFQKDTTTYIYTKSPFPEDNFLHKEISPHIDYLKVGSFSSQYPLLSEAEEFYRDLEGKLVKKHLILDLRDNGGGGDRNSHLLFKQLKKYLRKNNIYIITNASTGSNAEQFTVKLKKYENVISFGDKTKGALAYEIETDDYHSLPMTNFNVILTSKAHRRFLPYETVGVIPDHFLDYRKSWITQVEDFIQQKN